MLAFTIVIVITSCAFGAIQTSTDFSDAFQVTGTITIIQARNARMTVSTHARCRQYEGIYFIGAIGSWAAAVFILIAPLQTDYRPPY